MPTIYDNIRIPFLENEQETGLRDALKASRKGDFCVGYFNLRGWRSIDDVVGAWPNDDPPACRLLVGMQRLPENELHHLFGGEGPDERLDNKRVARLKRSVAEQFRRQLTIGIPTAEDEAGLRRLAIQLRDGRLRVKLFLRHPLHAKLYLAHRVDAFQPTLAYLGSSNLTMSGLKGQGELNIDVADNDASAKLLQWFEDRWNDSHRLSISL